MSNSKLQNLYKDTIVSMISNAVVDAATHGEKKHNTYISKKELMTYSHDELQYILDKVQQNFPESSVSLKVVSRGRQQDITLSDLGLVILACPMNDAARIAIGVDWSRTGKS
jgi:hypothetical protein